MTVPYSATLERSVLGTLLLNPDAIPAAASTLAPSDFYQPTHARIFEAVCDLWRSGVRPDAVLVDEELRRRAADVRMSLLVELTAQAPSLKVEHHARLLAEYATRRRLLEVVGRLSEALQAPSCDLEAVLGTARADLATVSLPARLSADDVVTVDEFCARTDPPTSWVIPGLVDVEDRIIVVAPEGMGKSYLLRQLALMAGQGIHPFTLERIQPVTTLIVDLENPGRIVRSKSRAVKDAVRFHVADYQAERTWLWHRPAGVDLRSRAGAAELDAVLAKVKPRLVCLGPLYKAFRADSNKREHDMASEVAFVLDDLRTRHGFGLVLEHHAPLKQGAVRELRPFGSLLWTQWPEVGIKLIPEDEGKTLKVGYWKGSRDERPWPSKLTRGRPGQTWPWEAHYA